MLEEPLAATDAETLARQILVSGEVRFLAHFKDRAAARRITPAEAVEAVVSGAIVNVQQRKGTWRYRFETDTTVAVVFFENANTLWFMTTYDPRNPETGDRPKE